MSEHAKLSASGAHRWTKCTASIELEDKLLEISGKLPDKQSEFAAAGTALHNVCAEVLESGCDVSKFNLNDDALEIVLSYVDRVKSLTSASSKVFIEKRVDYSFLDDVKYSSAFGTADCIIVDSENSVIHVIDLKTGKKRISAFKNLQLILYAIGAYKEFSDCNISYVRCHIVQPSLDVYDMWGCNVEELMGFWVDFFKNSILKIYTDKIYLPEVNNCNYCKPRTICAATFNLIKDKLIKIMDKEILTDEDKKWVLDNSAIFENFINFIKDDVKEMILTGKGFEGYKLVQGRGTRRVTETGKVALEELYGDLIYKKSLKGFAELEKELGKGSLNDFVETVYASPVLAPTDDRREKLMVYGI